MPTTTPNLRIVLPINGQDRHWGISYNAAFGLLDSLAPLSSLMVAANETPSASLTVRIAPGKFVQLAGTVFGYPGGTVSVAASATTYLWLTDAGVLTTGAAIPPPPVVPLASVSASASSIVAIADCRMPYRSTGQPAQPTPRTLVGTANQVLVTTSGSTVTFATPQAIDPTASPTFAGVAVPAAPSGPTMLANKQYVDAAVSGVPPYSPPQALAPTSSPTFASVTITATPASSGQVASKGYVDSSIAAIPTYSPPQNLASAASPTFASVNVSAVPTAAGQLANKGYVDAQVAAVPAYTPPQPIAPTSAPTFASITVVAAPTATGQVANKGYVDGQVSAASSSAASAQTAATNAASAAASAQSQATTATTNAASAQTTANAAQSAATTNAANILLRVARAGDTMTGMLGTVGRTCGNRSVTAAYAMAALDEIVFANAASAGFTVTLPTAVAGLKVRVVKTDATVNAVTVKGATTGGVVAQVNALIAGLSIITTTPKTFVSDGTNWYAS